MSILLDEADAYERVMDDDLTFQTVRELAGTAYMAGRSAPPTATLVPDRAASRTREEPMAEHGNVRRARRMA